MRPSINAKAGSLLTSTMLVAVMLASSTFVPAAAGAQPEQPTCRGEVASVTGIPGDDDVTLFEGTAGADVIVGTAGPDLILGRGGDDLICGMDGADEIRGGAGQDRIFAGKGHDVAYGGKDDDRIVGGRGHDELFGSSGDDRISGSRGHDELIGRSGDDQLRGRDGDDILRGGKGVDDCRGGRGDDDLRSCNPRAVAVATGDIYAIGDSVMLGATSMHCGALESVIPGIVEDAAVGRQFSEAAALVRSANAPDGAVFVIGLGTNGPMSASQIDALVGLNSSYRYVFVTVSVPRSWEGAVNAALRAAVDRHGPRVTLADWHAVVSADPALVAGDRIHLSFCAGAKAYAAEVAAAVRRLG